ncbi:hypothetical protein DSM106972_002980 [Dulcicalothrix desertica PCC 7102]|uniref:DUF4926 domain-containing protein n=1 Tax=Dulcicalothrix desertica PCC 7102 TaxID=232991 RepID=A0A433VUL7_9CYAN|nr:DUF4926 domain-containing protein [Dulcicalothrix desertica]RUT09803.1 hypothetical protein DSM106972_002980 [Dulcicalothrix desertica PCC 7102]TWH50993.1 uncharacterized protein DUF4926 [Dulcicalothrix desertica PCC 7102]
MNIGTINAEIRLLDIVALVEDLPEYGIYRGQVGTVTDIVAENVFEVDFSDTSGQTFAELNLTSQQLMLLLHEPISYLSQFVLN